MIVLQPGEKILMEVRKHWIIIVTHAMVMFVLALIPLFVAPFAVPIFVADVALSTYLFFGAAWLWFVWAMFFVMWTNYYLDVLVITNKRIIDIEQFVLFARDEVIVPLDHIEDIKIEVIGFLATILHFGDVHIQTAGTARETVAESIMRPTTAHACISHAIEDQKALEV